jgi:hypothetical protein
MRSDCAAFTKQMGNICARECKANSYKTLHSVYTHSPPFLQALKDLDGLMVQAKECITIVQRYAAISASKGTDNSGGESSGSETATEAGADVNEMEDIMLNIGMVG